MVANLIEFPPPARVREEDTDPEFSDKLVDGPGNDDVEVPEADKKLVLDKTDDRLADLYDRPWPAGIRDRVRYDHSKQRWHVLAEKTSIWRPDETGMIYFLMAECLGRWMASAALDGATGKIAAYSVLLNQQKKESVLKALRWHRGIAMKGDEWDPDSNLLGCANGIVDLRTAKLIRGQHPELLVTRSTGIVYEPDAWQTKCPRFMSFLLEITSGNLELTQYLLRVLGYSLYGAQREQKFWVFIGNGQNGKGVLVKAVAHVLGDYAMFASSAMYMRSKHGDPGSSGPRADLMALQGKRFLTTSEPVQGAFNDELVKHHTGGDPVRARALHSNTELQFPPTWTIFFLTNNPPKLEDVGKSMQRRLRAVHFNEDFSGPRDDKNLEELFKGPEAVGILSTLVMQAALYFDAGLTEPEIVTDSSRQYIEENDPISEFIHDCCVIEPRVSVQSKLLFAEYMSWSAETGAEALTLSAFGAAIARRFTKEKRRNGIFHLGIRLKGAMELAAADQGS
jgi:P4 family phage/plasmid primase-like protien